MQNKQDKQQTSRLQVQAAPSSDDSQSSDEEQCSSEDEEEAEEREREEEVSRQASRPATAEPKRAWSGEEGKNRRTATERERENRQSDGR